MQQVTGRKCSSKFESHSSWPRPEFPSSTIRRATTPSVDGHGIAVLD